MSQQPIDYALPATRTGGTKLRRLGGMHPAVAVALIAGGVILIVAPFYINAEWMTPPLLDHLPGMYALACFCIGVAMIGIAVVASIFRGNSPI